MNVNRVDGPNPTPLQQEPELVIVDLRNGSDHCIPPERSQWRWSRGVM